MKNSEKKRESIVQLMRACQEMAVGFEMMLAKAEMSPDDWGQAVSALSETLAVARVQWAEAVAELAEQAQGGEYSIQLLDPSGMPSAGASFPAASDGEAEDEARALALMHDWARRATLLHKGSGRTWTIQVGQ